MYERKVFSSNSPHHQWSPALPCWSPCASLWGSPVSPPGNDNLIAWITSSTKGWTQIENQNIKKVQSPPSHQSYRCRSPLRVILGNVDVNTRIDVKILRTKIQIKINLCHSLGERSTFQWNGNFCYSCPFLFCNQASTTQKCTVCKYTHTQPPLTDLKLWPSKYKANNYWVANKDVDVFLF